jgi:alkylation response protein AidB-like acyl-CoA dehydrogenase
MGRACLPGPFFSTVVLGGLTILEAGTQRQKQELLPKIAKGEMMVTLAITEFENGYDPSSITVTAKAKGEGFIIHGTKLFVPNAHVADYLLCVARTGKGKDPEDGITLFIIDGKAEGIKYTLLNTIAKDKQYEIFFNKVKVPKENMLGELNKGWRPLKKILQKAALAKCAEMVGGGQQVLDMAVSYAKKRVQFGKPIGSFQAIQHHCSNMLVDLDGCRWVTYKAAWMMDEGIPCEKQVSMAKVWCNDALRRIVALGHQVIGGVGYCEDHDMPLHFRMARMAEITFGDSDFHRMIVAKQLFSGQ